MIKLPRLPQTFTSRRIECVGCHSHIAVAEEFFHVNQPGNNGHQDARLGFRLRSNELATTGLHFQEVRSRRLVGTASRAASREGLTYPPADHFDNDIRCPRCGTDNRNWIQIQHHPLPGGFLAGIWGDILFWSALLIGLFAAMILGVAAFTTFDIWDILWRIPQNGMILGSAAFIFMVMIVLIIHYRWRIFGRADDSGLGMSGALIGTAVALIAFSLTFNRNPHALWERAVPISAITFAAGFIPAVLFPRLWRIGLTQVRLHRHLPEFARPVWIGPVILALGIFILMGFIVPLGGYIGLPIVIDRLFDQMEPPPTLSPRQTIIQLQGEIADFLSRDDLPQESRDALKDLQADLQNGLNQMPPSAIHLELLRQIITELEDVGPTLPGELPFATGTAVSELYTYEFEFVSQVPVYPDPGFQVPENIPWSLFAVWATFVGAATFISVGLGWTSQRIFVGRINAQLPPPIFHSIAAMTRIVAWEAKHALEVRGVIMDYIQWTAVARNELGGITLTGLHRDQPELQIQQTALGQRIPAQVYTVKSDRWAGVVDACIVGSTAGHAPRVPYTSLSKNFFAEVDQQAYQNLRP